jgi:hypothetical protein
LGAPVVPVAVLFGLNALHELDRTAFAVLLPDIRDHFGLTNASALGASTRSAMNEISPVTRTR